jgi:hypothetical protein
MLLDLAFVSIGSRPSESWADGDPASDVLLGTDVFYSYRPKASPGVETALEQALGSAAHAGALRLKVAIIGAPEELGFEQQLWGQPQAYARFLDSEISFNQPVPLLVVMPAGFGVMPETLARGLAGVPVYARQKTDGLTRSAMLAVVALAREQGHAIATPSIAPSSSRSSPPALLVFGLPAVLLALAGLAVMRTGRRRSGEHRSDADED